MKCFHTLLLQTADYTQYEYFIYGNYCAFRNRTSMCVKKNDRNILLQNLVRSLNMSQENIIKYYNYNNQKSA